MSVIPKQLAKNMYIRHTGLLQVTVYLVLSRHSSLRCTRIASCWSI